MGDCKKHLSYFDVTLCMLIRFLAITFVFWLQMTQDLYVRYSWLLYTLHDFKKNSKMLYYPKIAPNFYYTCQIWVLFNKVVPLKMNLELKFGGDGLLIDLQILIKGFLKIVKCMLYRSPQIVLLFACILKYVIYNFSVFLVNDHLYKVVKSVHLLFSLKIVLCIFYKI